MNCEEAGLLLNALIDGELDAGHARDIEAHLAGCQRCSALLVHARTMRQALSAPALRYEAPAGLRARIDRALPATRAAASNRRALLKGFAFGSLASAAIAASAAIFVVRLEQDDRILGDVVSAHLRSLQADHLIDVQSTDQHTVKPWFNGRTDLSPPVIDLTAQGFTLIGGRLDFIDGKPAAAIVYKRRAHIINLFVTQGLRAVPFAARLSAMQGFNIRQWTEQGLSLLAVSDINAEELQEFGEKFTAGLHAGGTG